LEEAGYKTALTNTIRFKIGDKSRPNLYKMSMPGRFFMQKFLRDAVNAKCDYAILEMTSQGSLTYRHRWIDLDAFVFTNISPEHIEAHGSYEKYLQAKLNIIRDSLAKSKKPNRVAIVNVDDGKSQKFLDCVAEENIKKIKYGLADAQPYTIKKEGIDFTFDGNGASSPLSGLFNLYNILAAATAAKSQGVSDEIIFRAVGKFADIPGRVEKIEVKNAEGLVQDFTVVVDYAHTADSLEKLYKVFRPDPRASRDGVKLVAVLGGTGGGRDTRKRKIMGELADRYCDEIILTDEDPYDENPRKIVDDVAAGITSKKPIIIMDRRLAIREAIKRAKPGDFILITGKGTDPYIMGSKGSKIPWSDARIAKEELEKIK
jgi:UDP-N-acetylmuramoyl-L-alanyl-D-glutamate--2,6-diaminopimelate ligase